MPQTRLHVTLPRPEALRAYALLEAEFEEAGWPLALSEVDEARDLCAVELYVDESGEPDLDRAEAVLREAGLATALERESLPDTDWVTKSLQGLQPVRAGRFLVHGSHDRARVRANDLSIEIEAGLAFGTGHHGTTAGCLEMIERVVRAENPRNALDLGTGSAVLAIGLAKFAPMAVLATDIDPVATRVAAENVRLNGASARVSTVTATGFAHRDIAARAPYDLIVANILARPLMRLAPKMAAHLAPGGSLILSGILVRQRNAVVAAYVGQRFRHVRTLTRGEWVTIYLKR